MNKEKIWLSSPHMGGGEIKYVKEAFDGNWIAPIGPNLNLFEKELEQYLGEGNHVAAVSSGTSAIHLALIQLGVGLGDEVICQSMTFCGSANPIVYQGAKPVFVDSETDTWNMSPHYLEEAIKDRLSKNKSVKAIIPVHLYGMPAQMDEIVAIGDKYGIPIVEDAAEGLGASINGVKCGNFGEYSIISFNGNKIITTSGGGALISRSLDNINRAKYLSTQARDAAAHYEHTVIGYNYRMSNVCAGIGRGQLEVLDEWVNIRRSNYDKYVKMLSKHGVEFLSEPAGYFSNRWLTSVVINPKEAGGVDREAVRLSLEKLGIESRPLWKPMHMQSVFKECDFYGDGTSEVLFKDGLCLPSGSNLTEAEWLRIEDAFAAIFDGKVAEIG